MFQLRVYYFGRIAFCVPTRRSTWWDVIILHEYKLNFLTFWWICLLLVESLWVCFISLLLSGKTKKQSRITYHSPYSTYCLLNSLKNASTFAVLVFCTARFMQQNTGLFCLKFSENLASLFLISESNRKWTKMVTTKIVQKNAYMHIDW